jgi:undecaprenyl-diphosphatase
MDAGEISWLEAVILGVVQGLTEFLPISSSAHILIVSQLFGWEDPGAAFTAVTQIGTEVAVLIYFRHDIVRILRAWWLSLAHIRDRTNPAWTNIDAKMGWYVIVGSIPIVILGLTFAHQIETAARNLYLVAIVLIVFGIVLGIADRFGKKTSTLAKLNLRDGILFGFGQALALIPGVSRSGATITAGLALGYTREAAARYSFLLAIPAVLGSGAYEATRLSDAQSVAWGPTLLATLVAALIGYSVIAWLLRWISTHSFAPFVVYRIALGSLVLILLSAGVLTT